jgi:putative transposase
MPFEFHGRALRVNRFSEPYRSYLITLVSQDRQVRFIDWHTARPVVAALRAAHDDEEALSLCWVIMPDHVHWLVELRSMMLSQVIGRMKSRSTLLINRQGSTRGQIWQRGFHDRAVRREDDLKTMARYIVNNPVRAGLVTSVRHYSLWDAIWI